MLLTCIPNLYFQKLTTYISRFFRVPQKLCQFSTSIRQSVWVLFHHHHSHQWDDSESSMSSPFSPPAYPGTTSPEITCKITDPLLFILTATPLVLFLLTRNTEKQCQQNQNIILICLKHILIYRALTSWNLDQPHGKVVEGGWVGYRSFPM